MSPLAFLLGEFRASCGFWKDGLPDLAQFSLVDGGRQQRARIRELEELGRGPGRLANADGSFYCDFDQSLSAMELLRFMVVLVFLSGGDVRRRRVRALTVREGSRDLFVIFFLFRVL